VLQAVGTVGET